jgi:hypothetical protein
MVRYFNNIENSRESTYDRTCCGGMSDMHGSVLTGSEAVHALSHQVLSFLV